MADTSHRPETGTLVNGVMQTIRARIASRALVPGARLPSLRTMAQTLAVSKTTVVDAYDRLVADGTITARRGAGFYVSGRAAPLSLADIGPRLDRAVDPLWIARQSLEAGDTLLTPGCGWMPATWMPDANIRRALRALARDSGTSVVDYDLPLGSPALRQHLAWRIAERGIDVAPDQLLLTDSGTQAVDLVCRFLLEPGDTVLIDDPCYFNFLALLRAHRVRIVGVPYTPAGPDLQQLASALIEHRPRLYLTNATLHNPTGATLSPTVAHRVLKLAEQHDLLIIEDDIFADFENDTAARLGAFDGLSRVIYVGSFSKTLSAGIRCGYIAARHDWIDGLTDLKLALSFGNTPVAADLVHRLLTDGSYRRHVDATRAKLADAMSDTMRRLHTAGLTSWTQPNGGMFVWARLPDGLDAARVAQAALTAGVVLAPGNVFSASHLAPDFLRFNVSRCNRPRVFDALQRAMASSASAG
jgi:DNA-binding transcriptional MocR family regulator